MAKLSLSLWIYGKNEWIEYKSDGLNEQIHVELQLHYITLTPHCTNIQYSKNGKRRSPLYWIRHWGGIGLCFIYYICIYNLINYSNSFNVYMYNARETVGCYITSRWRTCCKRGTMLNDKSKRKLWLCKWWTQLMSSVFAGPETWNRWGCCNMRIRIGRRESSWLHGLSTVTKHSAIMSWRWLPTTLHWNSCTETCTIEAMNQRRHYK